MAFEVISLSDALERLPTGLLPRYGDGGVIGKLSHLLPGGAALYRRYQGCWERCLLPQQRVRL
jgi:hypothetical protein